ncbi:unnamed protein product [Cunninghamella echinulata]
MTDNFRGRHKQSYKNNSNNRGRYRKHGNKNSIYSYPKDHVQYDHVEDERVSFGHLDHNLENVDDSINMESWRSSNTVKKYFGLGYTKQQQQHQYKSSTVDKQFNTLSLKEQQQQGSNNNNNNNNDNDNNNNSNNDNNNNSNNNNNNNNNNVINAPENQEEDEEIGFYFDSTPTPVNNNTQKSSSILSTMFVKGKDLDKPDITTSTTTDNQNDASIKDDDTIYMDNKSHNNNKKKGRHKQKGRKILKGDDIYISSSSDEEDQVHVSDRNNDKIMLEEDQEQEDNDDEEEAYADYIKNTDPDTWAQFELLANTRPVDNQLHGQINDYNDDHLNEVEQHNEENDNDDDDDDDNDIVDFGLGDSDEEEIGNQFNYQLSYQQQYSNNLYASPQLHAGMHNGYMTYYPPNYMPSFPSSHPPPQSPVHFHPPPNHFDPNYPPSYPPPPSDMHQQTYPLATYSQNHYSSHNNSNNKNDISYQLRRVDRRLQAFIMDSSRNTYQLPGMSDYCRRLVQGLATQYRLKLTPEILSNGKIGPLLRKSPRTCLPEDRKAIERHITKKRSLYHAKKVSNKKPKDGKGKGKNGNLQQQQVSSKPKGKIVGQHAAPLASNNIGHKMMAAMGWKEGESLGSNKDGILGPIEVRIRTKRRGLGH